MLKQVLGVLLLFSLFCFKADEGIPVIKWSALEKYMNTEPDQLKIINFWATWCKPCMEELPYFEKIHREYKGKNVEVLLVSLDQASHAHHKVKASLEKNGITAQVVLLDEVDFNQWINKIDEQWSGSIPATLIIHRKKKIHLFHEKELTFEELQHIISTINP